MKISLRPFHRPKLVTVLATTAILLSIVNTINTNANSGFRQAFPGQGAFQINASFGLLGPNGLSSSTNIVLPGDIVNGSLAISSKAHRALTLYASFNTTGDASLWGCNPSVCNDIGRFQVPSLPLTLQINGVSVLPENTPYITTDPSIAIFTRVPLVVAPGDNTYSISIISDVLTPSGTQFVLNFFASQ